MDYPIDDVTFMWPHASDFNQGLDGGDAHEMAQNLAGGKKQAINYLLWDNQNKCLVDSLKQEVAIFDHKVPTVFRNMLEIDLFQGVS